MEDKYLEKYIDRVKEFDEDYIGTPLSSYSRLFFDFNVGDIILGRVTKISDDFVTIDVGSRNIGDIPIEEFKDCSDILKVGGEFNVYIVDIEEKEGKLILSKKKADFELSWQKVETAFQKQERIKCRVLRAVKAGVMVEVFNFIGFVPASKLDLKRVEDLTIFEGEEYEFKIIEIDKDEQKIILSRRKVLEEDMEKQREEFFKKAKEGDIVEGEIFRITPSEVFVNVSGAVGIINISEISWRKISHPGNILKESERVKCKILSINLDEKKVHLSIKQALPNPWENIDAKFYVGKIVEGEVLRIFDFGVFVKVDEQIEGLIPTNELSDKKISRGEEVVSIGDRVKVKIINLQKDKQRMILSLKSAKQEQEKNKYQDFISHKETKGTTIGDIIEKALKEKEK